LQRGHLCPFSPLTKELTEFAFVKLALPFFFSTPAFLHIASFAREASTLFSLLQEVLVCVSKGTRIWESVSLEWVIHAGVINISHLDHI
jgi:hypothetical protein